MKHFTSVVYKASALVFARHFGQSLQGSSYYKTLYTCSVISQCVCHCQTPRTQSACNISYLYCTKLVRLSQPNTLAKVFKSLYWYYNTLHNFSVISQYVCHCQPPKTQSAWNISHLYCTKLVFLSVKHLSYKCIYCVSLHTCREESQCDCHCQTLRRRSKRTSTMSLSHLTKLVRLSLPEPWLQRAFIV